jgi:DNA-binding MurR/RpiR family transcriptional regulator
MLMQQYDSFTRAEKKIADYVLSHKLESQYMTITELAERTGVAEATLTRFCRTLGCGGFGEFKLALAKDSTVALDTDETGGLFENIDPSDGVEELCQKLYHANREALNQTYQLVEPKKVSLAVDLIQQAQRVYCYGQGGSSIMAMEAWGRFVTVTNKVQWVQDSHMQAIAASLLDPGDVILFFSFSGATKDLMDVAHIAVQTGVRLILVTRFPSAPAAALADVVLLCGAVEGPLQMGSVSAKVAQLYLIDVLFNEFCRRDQAQTSKNRERTLDSIANKLL